MPFQPLGFPGFLPAARAGGAAASAVPRLTPEAESNALAELGKTAGNAALGLASTIGYVFDTPAAFLRGLLADQPGSRVSGEDLLESLGESDPGWLAGFLTEVALDPLTYLSFGSSALTKAGRAAGKVGALRELPEIATKVLGRKVGKRTARTSLTLGDVYGHVGPKLQEAIKRSSGAQGAAFDELLGQRLGGIVNFGLPFTSGRVIGASQAGESFARGIDAVLGGAGSLIDKTPLIGAVARGGARVAGAAKQHLGALFDYSTLGARQPETQAAGRIYTRRVEALSEPHEIMSAVIKQLDDAGFATSGEGAEAVSNTLSDLLEFPAQRAGAHPVLADIAGKLAAAHIRNKAALTEIGSPMQDLLDQYSKGYRARAAMLTSKEASRLKRAGGTIAEATREDIFKNFPRGTTDIEKMVKDPLAWEAKMLPDRAAYIRSNYLDFSDSKTESMAAGERSLGRIKGINREVRELKKLLPLQPNAQTRAAIEASIRTLDREKDVLKAVTPQSEGLANFIESIDKSHQDTGWFSNHVLTDQMHKMDAQQRRIVYYETHQDMLADVAKPAGEFNEPTVPLARAIHAMGLESHEGVKRAEYWHNRISDKAAEGSYSRLASRGKVEPIDADEILERMAEAAEEGIEAPDPIKQMREAIGELHIPERVLHDIDRVSKVFDAPDEVKPFLSFLFKGTSLWKTGALLRPSYYFRNETSGLAMNFMLDFHDPRFNRLNWKRWFQPYADANALRRGRGAAGIVRGIAEIPALAGMNLTDEAAGELLRGKSYGLGVTGRAFHQREFEPLADAASGAIQGDTLAKTTERIPGQKPDTLKAALKSLVKPEKGWSAKALNPLQSEAITGKPTEFWLEASGRRIGNITEETNRLAGWIALLRQGHSFDEAARMVRAAHVDYTSLSKFERSVMRSVAPFYTWSRRITPVVLKHLVEHPGGVMAQHIRLANNLRSREGFVPERVSSTSAIPIGALDEAGTQAFLTNLGDLPHETLNDLLTIGGGGLQKTGAGLFSMINPMYRVLPEAVMGWSATPGDPRPGWEREGRIGRLLEQAGVLDNPKQFPWQLEAASQAVPYLSTVLNTAGLAADPRKNAWEKLTNFLTGVRTTTVDQKDRDYAARQFIENELRGAPAISLFEGLYVKDRDLLTPEQQLLMQLNQSLVRRRQEAAR